MKEDTIIRLLELLTRVVIESHLTNPFWLKELDDIMKDSGVSKS